MRINYPVLTDLVRTKHRGQSYGKHDYYYHLECVRNKVDDICPEHLNHEFRHLDAIALCHDLLEDTNTTYDELVYCIGKSNAEAVKLLSKNYCVPYSYEKYINLIKTNELALIVKKADTLCNLEESVKINDIKRIKKYTKQLVMLCED